jgi:gas vesicle protein
MLGSVVGYVANKARQVIETCTPGEHGKSKNKLTERIYQLTFQIMKNIRIALAIALAAGAGLAAGILIAPEKGARTRRKFRNTATDLMDDLEETCQDTIQDFKDKVERKYREIAHQFECGSTSQSDESQHKVTPPAATNLQS